MARVFTWTVTVYDTMSDFPATGDVDVIYIDASTNKPYRYDDSYYQISSTDVSVWGAIGSVYKGSGDTYVPYTGATGNVDLGEYELKAGQLEFDQTPTGTAGVGVMRWNDQDGTADLGLKGGNVTLQIGQEQVTRVVNKTGSDLLEANYQAVRISGAQGNRLKVDLAQANNDANSADTIGIVTETINNNQEGFVTTSGLVRNIDTTGSLQSETWADGDMLYLSGTTAGRITNVKPSAPTHTIIIGYVVRAHATQGQIYVKVDNGYELDELHNVAITSVANNDVLQYDSATSLWKNESLSNAGIQPTLVSGTSIKTINSTSLLGSGNISVQPTLTLTTTGTSGAATLVGSTLNIPQYSGGASGITIGTTSITSGTINRLLFQGTGNVVQQSSSLTFNGTQLVVGASGNAIPNATQIIRVVNNTNGADAEINGNGYARIFFNDYSQGSNLKYYEMLNYLSDFKISRLNDLNTVRTERLTIFGATGNVNIGTTNPSDAGYRLDINGTTRIQGKLSVNTPSATSAVMEVTSTTQGFLPPRMTTTQKNAISSPAAGLIIYDTTLNKLCVRTASAWETITSV